MPRKYLSSCSLHFSMILTMAALTCTGTCSIASVFALLSIHTAKGLLRRSNALILPSGTFGSATGAGRPWRSSTIQTGRPKTSGSTSPCCRIPYRSCLLSLRVYRELAALVLTSGCKQIVKILGAYVTDDPVSRADNPFQVVRPFYPRTLEKVLWSPEEVSFLRALYILRDVAKGMRYLHVLGFVHENIKPGSQPDASTFHLHIT